MSLPDAQWRYIGSAAFTASAGALVTALMGLGTAATYHDGTTRTVGSGSAGTWTEVAAGEAISITPVAQSLNHRLLLAISASSVTGATGASPDTPATNTLMGGVNKNSGAYSDWKSATPFTTGQWFGFWRNYQLSAGAGTVFVFESTRSVWVVIVVGTGSYHLKLGCPIDPQSTDPADAESDGYCYGAMTTGSAAYSNGTMLSIVSIQTPFWHLPPAGQSHFAIFTPGAGTLKTVNRKWLLNVTGTTTGGKTPGGLFAREAYPIRATLGAPNDHTVGELWGIKVFTNGVLGTRQDDGATRIGYVVSMNNINPSEAFLLEHGS